MHFGVFIQQALFYSQYFLFFFLRNIKNTFYGWHISNFNLLTNILILLLLEVFLGRMDIIANSDSWLKTILVIMLAFIIKNVHTIWGYHSFLPFPTISVRFLHIKFRILYDNFLQNLLFGVFVCLTSHQFPGVYGTNC